MNTETGGNNIPDRYLDAFNARVCQQLFEADMDRFMARELGEDCQP